MGMFMWRTRRQGVILKYQTNGTFVTSFAGSGAGLLSNPTGVALDTSGNIYVADQGTDQVVVLTSGGALSNTWGGFGSNAGQFIDPEEVSVDPNTNNVYVADTGNQRVQEFTNGGTFINWFTGQTPYEPSFGNPAGIFVLNANQIYVADSANNDIAVIGSCFGIVTPTVTNTYTVWPTLTATPTGTFYTPTPAQTNTFTDTATFTSTNTFTSTISPTPTITPNSSSATGVCLLFSQSFYSFNNNVINGSAIDGYGNLYLAQNDIVVLNSQGQDHLEFGSSTLQYPEGIAINNPLNLVYVVDADTNLIDVFNLQTGSLLNQFGTVQGGGTLNNPTGVALDLQGNVYVADTDNDQVDEFTQTGSPVTVIGNLDSPEGIAVDGSGNIFVGEAGLARITKFNSAYQKQLCFNGNNILGEPYEMKFDSKGFLWVADTQNNLLITFDDNGNYLNSFAGNDVGGSQFNEPMVSIDANENVFAPNSYGALVQKFVFCESTNTPTVVPSCTNTFTNTITSTPTITPTPTNTANPSCRGD